MKATLTVLRDDQHLLQWPPVGRPLKLLDNEANLLGTDPTSMLLAGARPRASAAVRMRGGRWVLRAITDGFDLDSVAVDKGVDVELHGGEVITLRNFDVDAVFAVNDAAALDHLAVVADHILLDGAGTAGPGRWWSLQRRDGAVHASLMVAHRGHGDADALRVIGRGAQDDFLPGPSARFDHAGALWRVYADFPRGVPLRELSARGPGLEPAVAVAVLRELARRVDAPPIAVSVDHAWVGFDGTLRLLPPVWPLARRGTTHGLLVELSTSFLTESSPWWSDMSVGSVAARRLRSRLVHPWLGGIQTVRAPEPDDVRSPSELVAACDALPGLRPVSLQAELQNLTRGLFPDEWRHEQALREELDLIDDAAFAALVERAVVM